MSFIAESGSGHSVVMDGAPEHGGRNLAPRPMEMVLIGLGGCTAFDVVQILIKSGLPVKGCEVVLEAARADAVPAVFTSIHVHYIVQGAELQERHVKRAVDLSIEKYCSVTMMLRPTVNITHDFEIV
jgi:putative redox protein